MEDIIWIEDVFPIKHGYIPASYVSLPEGNIADYGYGWLSQNPGTMNPVSQCVEEALCQDVNGDDSQHHYTALQNTWAPLLDRCTGKPYMIIAGSFISSLL